MASEIEVRQRLVKIFPGLSQSPFELTSEPTPSYNCIAWAAGVNDQFWWPGATMWPKNAKKKVTREAFVQAFATRGFAPCEHPDPEEGFEKIALYERDGEPTHAARQLPDGRWSSKLGQAHDIAHSIEALNGDQYGEPVLYLKRPIGA
jgi:hypothetical protein